MESNVTEERSIGNPWAYIFASLYTMPLACNLSLVSLILPSFHSYSKQSLVFTILQHCFRPPKTQIWAQSPWEGWGKSPWSHSIAARLRQLTEHMVRTEAYGGLRGPVGPALLSLPPGCGDLDQVLLAWLFSLEGSSSVNELLSHSLPWDHCSPVAVAYPSVVGQPPPCLPSPYLPTPQSALPWLPSPVCPLPVYPLLPTLL